MARRIAKGPECLNCGQELSGENFCPNCGQLNNTAKPTFGELIADALANLFAWDSKFYLSIWPLLTRPGKLSLEIVNGKKNSYLPPIRLFVLMVIISLLLSSLSSRMQRNWDDVHHLKSDQNSFVAQGDSDSLKSETNNDIRLSFDDTELGDSWKRMFSYARSNPDATTDSALSVLSIDNTFWNKVYYTNALKLTLMSPTQYMSFIRSNLLIILLIFIPILALLLKILYFYKPNYYYVDHFIFSLHTQTALFVFISIAIIVNWFLSETFPLLIVGLGFPIYLFLALKNFYQQRKIYTFLNFIAINMVFYIVGLFFLILVLLVSFILI